MSRRFFRLTNFRNIGLDGNNENKIIINNSLKKGKMGGVVELIGANNSGKSNVLDAILEYGQSSLSDKDVTTLSFNEADMKPEVALVYQDDNGTVERVLDRQGKKEIVNLKNVKTGLNIEEVRRTCKRIVMGAQNYGVSDYGAQDIITILASEDKISERTTNLLRVLVDQLTYQSRRSNATATLYSYIPDSIKSALNGESNQGQQYIKDKYGYNFESKIINYVDNKINSSSLVCNINDLSRSSFFNSLFKGMGIDGSEIINGYNQYYNYQNIASLNKLRKMIDNKIAKLNNQFNKLYFAENDKYKFSVVLESSKISFGMARGDEEDPIMIEMQSTGFRWFFDFYFNFIGSNDLNPGDIVVMDEPATNLHPEGQRELRRFIKEFAIKNDITFIIATHSPFLVDPDNYDELRIISMDNNRTKIDNLFSAVNCDDPDSLIPIKDALTIKQNVLYDMDTQVVWVEGITDYNYLTMFKRLLDVKGVNFIPYNGNGKNDTEVKKVLSKLVDIKFYRRGILVDSDKSGEVMAKFCAHSVFKDRTYKISDVDEAKKTIEDLFSEEDRNKFESLNKKSDLYKKANYSAVMKNTAKLSDFSEETVKNFTKILNLITD